MTVQHRVLEEDPGVGSRCIQVVLLRVAGTTTLGDTELQWDTEPRKEMASRVNIHHSISSPTLVKGWHLKSPPHSQVWRSR